MAEKIQGLNLQRLPVLRSANRLYRTSKALFSAFIRNAVFGVRLQACTASIIGGLQFAQITRSAQSAASNWLLSSSAGR